MGAPRKKAIAPHKAIRRSCRWCKVRHTRKQHYGHGVGAYLRTHPGVRYLRSMPKAQDVFDWLVVQEAQQRLGDIVREHQAGAVELTGRTRVDEGGAVLGRFGGRFADLFPELADFPQGPAAIVRSIQSPRRTQLQRDIAATVANFVDQEHGDDIKAWMHAHPMDAVN